MRKIVLSVCIAFTVVFIACKSGGSEGKNVFPGTVDAQVEKLLAGKNIFADAVRVVPVIVNSEQGSGEKKENLESYAIVQKAETLTREQVRRLQNIIFNAATYDFNIAKKCMFQPYVGFIFEKAGKEAHALFCFSCNEVSFGRDGKRGNLEDFDAARKEMLSLVREIFPNDVELAGLRDQK